MTRVAGTLLAALCLAVPAPAAVAAPASFTIGIQDPRTPVFGEQDIAGAYAAASDANIRIVRIPLAWGEVAPNRPQNPGAHDSPGYNWSRIDETVRDVTSRGMEPLFYLHAAPHWARQTRANGSTRPAPRMDELATFAGAAARRYSGGVAGIPRVKNWQLWNEPNLKEYLGEADGDEQYRAMLRAVYDPIHAAAASNRVVAGGLAPFARGTGGNIRPLRFMRDLLCMSTGRTPRPTCDERVPFDAWSHHPYTNGAPKHSAGHPDDVSLGDLPGMRRLLRAAERAGHVTPGRSEFWVTEFSWDTKGPDPGGVPLARHARWVAEALYNMWRNDVSVAVWFQLRDNPEGAAWGQTFQSGLFFRTTARYADEKAKPVRQVIRFPFIALPSGRSRATVWGRSPTLGAATVVLERRARGRWARIGTVRANASGVFRRSVAARRGALVRGRVGGEGSVPFKVEPTPDRRVNAFGGPLQ